jgi:pilus assembly protein CpaB
MNKEASSVALIRPGDYVDVFAVMNQSQSEQKVAVVLLQRVLVLATGLDTSPDAVQLRIGQPGIGEYASLLTLSLPVTEAQLLALAQEKGKLAVVLRNPDDQRTAQSIPDLNSATLFDPVSRSKSGMPHGGTTGPVEIRAIPPGGN